MTAYRACFFLIILFPVLAHASVNPGMWEAEVVMSGTGGNASSSSERTNFCITDTNPMPVIGSNNGDAACQILNQKTMGSSVSWKMVCDTPMGQLTGNGKITYQGDNAKGSIDIMIKMPDGTSKLRETITAKRIGDCK